MTQESDYTRIKVMEVAGMQLPEIMLKYCKLVEFTWLVKNNGCCIACNICMACEAVAVLRKIGEIVQ